jgi:hypothetical protein
MDRAEENADQVEVCNDFNGGEVVGVGVHTRSIPYPPITSSIFVHILFELYGLSAATARRLS